MAAQTLSDGSVVEYNTDGSILRETSPDGSVYTDFDAQGRAHHVQIPASNGNPATSADIAYVGDTTVYTYADKSVITYDANNHITNEKLADGTDYTNFDADGRAHHVQIPASADQPATSADITYIGDTTIYTYADKSVITYDANNHITNEKLADGTDYTNFDADGRAHHVQIPASADQPATSADITYIGDTTIYTYADKSVITYDANNHITNEKLADGTDYTNFDADGRAHHVQIPASADQPATSADITYHNTDTLYTYPDHTTITYNSNDKIIDEKQADGTDYTQFDTNGNPHHVNTPASNGQPATSADITYHGTDTTYTYDQTTVTYDSSGNIIDEKQADGTDYTNFDANGNPHHVNTPASNGQPATSADITYHGTDTTYTYDQTTVTYDSSGNIIDEKQADGTDYTNFDANGNPHHVNIPASNGQPATSADITYHGTDTTYTYPDKSTVTYNANNAPIDEKQADGTDYTQFDTNGNPHHVNIPASNGQPATSADITYHGTDTTYTYPDKSTVTYNANNTPIDEKLADGTDYTQFDTNGNPHHVNIPATADQPATSADITYAGNTTTYTYPDHTTITYNANNTPIDEKLADGTDYTQFDTNGNPHHVNIPATADQPATSADITYAGNTTTYTYPDHTTITYNANNTPIDEKLADGTDYTQFDTNGNPHHVNIPATADQPATSADITYAGNTTTYTYPDHTTITYNANNTPIDEKLADGTDYTQFDTNGNPHHVNIPATADQPATSADITYAGNTTTYTYPDHTTITYNANNTPIDEKLADGTDYTQFDTNGNPHHVNIPATADQPATSADITYAGNTTTYTYPDHTTITYNANNTPIDEKLADGTDYTQFDADNRPTEVSIPAHGSTPAMSAQIAYDNAHTRYTFADKTVLTYQDSNNALVSERLADGTVYTQFDANQKPHHVDVPAYNGKPATSADISYSDGHAIYRYPDSTVVTYDEASNALLTQRLPDGTVYSDFDDNEQPHHVYVPATADKPAMSADITYDGGHSIYTYTDGSIVTYDTASNTILTEQMPDGQVFSDFDKDGNAHHVQIPATEKSPATSADISYDGGHTIYTYPDHTIVTYDTATNTIITEKMADGTIYSDFDANDNPHHVEIPATEKSPATSADISYDDGHTIYTYPDHTIVTYDTATNTIITEKMADGTIYSDFDANDNPHHVEIPPQNGKPGTSADITYANGQAIYTYTDGTKVYIDTASNQVVKQEMPDGWVINYVDGKPASGSNSQTGDTVTITVNNDGSSVWTYSDGTVVYEDPKGNVYKEVANGWTFTEFNGDGKPTYGTMTDADGNTETVTINYNFDGRGDTQWIYTDDGQTTTIVTDPNGAPISETNKDGTFLFSVELPKLLAAIKTISNERDTIIATIKAIGNIFDAVHLDWWTGPGSNSFYGHILDFRNLEQSVASVLSEAIQRMEVSYNNYVEAERASDKSLTPIPVETMPAFPAEQSPLGQTIPGPNLGPGPVVHKPTS